MDPAKPTLELLRTLTGEHVLRELMVTPRLTRAELAARTGISKPTISDSVRRLTEVGLLYDTGERTSGRGRAGAYYALSDCVGHALVLSVAPGGLVAELVNASGEVTQRRERTIGRPAKAATVRQGVRSLARTLARIEFAPIRLAVVSAADPVDRVTGRLVHLPDAPFLVGDLSPVDALAGIIDGPVSVDNDVNWGAMAERSVEGRPGLDDFAYLYLGEGLGCAIVADGDVRRGHTGLSGEIAHLLTVGPTGRAITFTQLFDALGLRRHGTTAVDVERLLATVQRGDKRSVKTLDALAAGTSGVLAAIVALTDPQRIIVGGTWGTHPRILDAIRDRFAALPRNVPIEPATITDAPLAGARQHAVRELRQQILEQALIRQAPRPPSTPDRRGEHKKR